MNKWIFIPCVQMVMKQGMFRWILNTPADAYFKEERRGYLMARIDAACNYLCQPMAKPQVLVMIPIRKVNCAHFTTTS